MDFFNAKSYSQVTRYYFPSLFSVLFFFLTRCSLSDNLILQQLTTPEHIIEYIKHSSFVNRYTFIYSGGVSWHLLFYSLSSSSVDNMSFFSVLEIVWFSFFFLTFSCCWMLSYAFLLLSFPLSFPLFQVRSLSLHFFNSFFLSFPLYLSSYSFFLSLSYSLFPLTFFIPLLVTLSIFFSFSVSFFLSCFRYFSFCLPVLLYFRPIYFSLNFLLLVLRTSLAFF